MLSRMGRPVATRQRNRRAGRPTIVELWCGHTVRYHLPPAQEDIVLCPRCRTGAMVKTGGVLREPWDGDDDE